MVISFLSDYGLIDPFVGVCHAVIARLAPHARVIDLAHGVPRQDVRAGAVMLADAAAYLPAGVVLGVVDPGVGTERRGVLLRAGAHLLVGPDNGLLVPAAEQLGGVEAAWLLPAQPGTFHGRDVFAPAAAHLANGADPGELAEACAPDALHRLALPAPTVEEGRLEAEVAGVDGFGNIALIAGRGDLDAAGLHPGEPVSVRAGDASANAVVATTFADVDPGGLVVIVDSWGRVAVAVNGGAAAATLGARPGTLVHLASRRSGNREE